MKGFLFLSLVGAAIYATLVVSHDLLPRDRAEDSPAGQSLGNPGPRQLHSWGTDLPALVSSPVASLPMRKPDVMPGSQYSEQTSGSGDKPVSEEKSTPAQDDGTAYEPTEWARVVVAARVHREASVSSPTMRFYQPGTALQVVSRENGWVQVTDLTSREGGWVFEQYLVLVDRPTVTETAMATTSNKALSEPTRANPVQSAKKRIRAPRPVVRVPDDVAFAQFDRRWERRAQRRGSYGLFFFGRFAGSE
jgi:hypothetical protein